MAVVASAKDLGVLNALGGALLGSASTLVFPGEMGFRAL